jgi:glucose/arabinose dehydrogenase
MDIRNLLLTILVLFCVVPGPVRAAAAECGRPDGLQLPAGFCATRFADGVGPARHLAVRGNGDVYVALSRSRSGGTIAALRDRDGDGRTDTVKYFGEGAGGTGIAVRNGFLYYAPDTALWRYRLSTDSLVPDGSPEMVVTDLPVQHQHAAKSFTFDGNGHVYMNIGAPSNACQQRDRSRGSPGLRPCPLLAKHGGVWRFNADARNQHQDDGTRFATGIRNAVALAWDPVADHLYLVQHGRDQLHSMFPERYSIDQSADLPAEEFFRVNQGEDFGWPYCYYDQHQHKKVLAPEYGGDGRKVGECDKYGQPIMAFPGHWAPDALLFYTGTQFPARYHGGAFIAFHGSWNRAPRPQQGYKVVFVPFDKGRPAGDYETFADGFAGPGPIASPGQANYRPVGLAQGPDGSLYVSDSHKGRIWKIRYVGHRDD